MAAQSEVLGVGAGLNSARSWASVGLWIVYVSIAIYFATGDRQVLLYAGFGLATQGAIGVLVLSFGKKIQPFFILAGDHAAGLFLRPNIFIRARFYCLF